MKDRLKGKEEKILQYWHAGFTDITKLAYRNHRSPNTLRDFLTNHQRNTSSKTYPISTLEIDDATYITGIIEVEGYFITRWVQNCGRYYIQSFITVETSDENAHRILQQITKNESESPYKHIGKRLWRSSDRWTLSSRPGTELLKQILPYLQMKKEQAELFIELTEIKLQSKPGHRFNEERQKEIVEKFRKLR